MKVTTIVQVLRDRAQHRPNNLAFTFIDSQIREIESLTYRQIDDEARKIAAYLQRHTSCGDRALLVLSEGPQFVKAFFGCMYAGLIVVPCYPPQSRKETHAQRLEAMIVDADPKCILTEEPYTADIVAGIESRNATKHLLCIALPLNSTDVSADDWRHLHLPSDRLALLQYTSGSTSAPKGVMITHANILANQEVIKSTFGHSENTVGVSWLPRYHDMGLIGHVIQPVYLGARSVLMAPLTFLAQPANWLRAISKYAATTSGAPNFAYQLCVDRITKEQMEDMDLKAWSLAYVGAEPVRADTIAAFATRFASVGFNKRALFSCYGLAEATLLVCGTKHDTYPPVITVNRGELQAGRVSVDGHTSRSDEPSPASEGQNIVSAGSINCGPEICIVDPDTQLLSGSLRQGEIWLRHESLSKGYWRNSTATAEAFSARLADGEASTYMRTGDLGFVYGDQLFVTGRIKDLIILRGRNHAPQDLELTVQRCSPLLQADAGSAFSVEHGGAEELIVVHELTRAGLRHKGLSDVIAAVRRAVIETHHVQPTDVVLIRSHSLPRTSSGKVRRSQTKEAYVAGTLSVIASWKTTIRPAEVGATAVAPGSRIVPSLVAILSEVLQVPKETIDLNGNFFDLGVDSLAMGQIRGLIESRLNSLITVTDIFAHSNINGLARFLETGKEGTLDQNVWRRGTNNAKPVANNAIAVIGIAGRFPDAPDLERFWENLRNAKESVRQFTDDEILRAGVAPSLMRQPTYVKAGVMFEGIELFDADFFGMTPTNARRMDPQQRILMECAVTALENAGYPQEQEGHPIGVFVGKGECFYQHRLVSSLNYRASPITALTSLVGLGAAYTATLISYHLGLTGPSCSVDTACSTSLVAVHQACRSILGGDCEMALAGGISLDVFAASGYLYEDHSILSPDGHCRTFSADARGTVRGSGVGLVVLKSLELAITDGDTIHAVIKGSAINNDGSRKAGYTAPSVAGQAQVIRAAMAAADVDPATISYQEAHGTSTVMGDPIEIAALVEAHSPGRGRSEKCALGSLKTNIGHLDAAAGIAGLLKVILSLKHREIPASLNCGTPNPAIDFANSPFYVNTALRNWASPTGFLRAGVSAFGIGGTNAHVVVEEAPPPSAIATEDSQERLFILSAKSELSLLDTAHNMWLYLRNNSLTSLADVAFTLQVGRRPYANRLYVIADDQRSLCRQLQAYESALPPNKPATGDTAVAFVFSGQYHHCNWRPLYDTNVLFREGIDRCAETLLSKLGGDIRDNLAVDPANPRESREVADVLAFSIEYSLAKMWISLGVKPITFVGFDLGELTAACLAGMFSLEDALALLLALRATERERDQGTIAASLSIDQHDDLMPDIGISGSLTPIFSSTTKEWVTQRQAADPKYWLERRHPANTEVNQSWDFAGVASNVFLEIGPRHPRTKNLPHAVHSPNAEWTLISATSGGVTGTLKTMGQLWICGVDIIWHRLYSEERRLRIPLPTYSFDRQRYWIDAKGDADAVKALPLSSTNAMSAAVNDEAIQQTGNAAACTKESTVSLQRRHVVAAYVPPSSDAERSIAHIFSEIMGFEPGIDDDFFELGGDSLVAARMLSRLSSTQQSRITVEEFYSAPTIRSVAEKLERDSKIDLILTQKRADSAASANIRTLEI